MILIIAISLCGCTKMRAGGWYNSYGIERQDLNKRESVPAITEALRDRNLYVRIYAARSLGQLGANAKEAIPALVGLLSDATPQVRIEASKSLSLIGLEGHTDVLPNIAKLLQDSNSGVRLHAIAAVGTLKQDALSTSSTLLGLVDDEHPAVRREAVKSLQKIQYRGNDYYLKLDTMAKNDVNIFNRDTAMQVLNELRKPSRE